MTDTKPHVVRVFGLTLQELRHAIAVHDMHCVHPTASDPGDHFAYPEPDPDFPDKALIDKIDGEFG